MIRKEIKHLRLKVSEYGEIAVSTPVSVLTALLNEGIITEPYYADGAACLDGAIARGAEISADFDVDAVMLGMDNLILSLGGLDAPLVLVINGVPIAGIENPQLSYDIDIKSRVSIGKNTLTLRFAPRAKLEKDHVGDISVYAPIELIAYNRAVIDTVTVGQDLDGDKMRLSIRMTSKGYNSRPRAVAVLVSPGGSVSYCTLSDGVGEIKVAAPSLWRVGKDRTHRLYRLTVNLYADTELIDTREYRLGLRTVSYDPTGVPRLCLSGEPYYPIAVRYSRTDLIKPRATDARTELMLRRLADSGIDMIYVDSEDVYPTERFLSACDELGIALAVRFIVPASASTAVGERLARRDIPRALIRLANHPSVIIVTGAGQLAGAVREDMQRYLPSALYLDEQLDLALPPPSLPTYYTSRLYFGEENMNITSPTVTDRCSADIPSLLLSISEGHRMPHSFEQWTYLSGVVSAESAVSALLRARVEKRGLGACVADLSEPIPALAPSVLDYSERVKAAYYYLARATRPVTVYAVANRSKISFYALNMESIVYKGRLNYAVISNDNRVVVRDSTPFDADPRSSSLVYEYDAREVIAGRESEYYISYSVTDPAGTHSRGTLLLVPPARFEFKKPTLTADITGAGCEYTVTVYSDVYARAVEIWLEGDEDAILEDNFFDITSDVPIRLRLTTARPTAVESLKRELRLRSMYDVGR